MKENKIQSECVKWFTNNYCLKHHNPQCQIFSVPNEAIQKMAWKQISSFKAMGLKSGVSDVIVLIPGKVLFIEFKTEKGTQTPKQRDFQQAVETLGFDYHICRSLDQFKKIIKKNTLKSL